MIKRLLLLIILAAVPVLMTHQNVAFATAQSDVLDGASTANGGSAPTGDLDTTIRSVINILTIAVGVVSIVMIIVAGLRYITSGGNADKTKSAKNTLIYAIVGLVIVALAQTIAHFALSEASRPGATNAPPSSQAPDKRLNTLT